MFNCPATPWPDSGLINYLPLAGDLKFREAMHQRPAPSRVLPQALGFVIAADGALALDLGAAHRLRVDGHAVVASDVAQAARCAAVGGDPLFRSLAADVVRFASVAVDKAGLLLGGGDAVHALGSRSPVPELAPQDGFVGVGPRFRGGCAPGGGDDPAM